MTSLIPKYGTTFFLRGIVLIMIRDVEKKKAFLFINGCLFLVDVKCIPQFYPLEIVWDLNVLLWRNTSSTSRCKLWLKVQACHTASNSLFQRRAVTAYILQSALVPSYPTLILVIDCSNFSCISTISCY